MGSCVSISLFVLSLVAQVWLFVELDPGRDTCEELVYESGAALGANALVFLLGCLRSFPSGYTGWLEGCGTLVLAAISAVAVILASRVTLFVHEANVLCAADVTANTTLPKTDLLRDTETREMLGGLSWAALVFFGAAVLLQHCPSWWGDEDCDYASVSTACPPKCSPECPPQCPGQCPPTRQARALGARVVVVQRAPHHTPSTPSARTARQF